MNNTKNKWLKTKKNKDLANRLDAFMMEAWAADATFGEFINSLPKDLRDFLLNMNFNTPATDETGFDLSFFYPE